MSSRTMDAISSKRTWHSRPIKIWPKSRLASNRTLTMRDSARGTVRRPGKTREAMQPLTGMRSRMSLNALGFK